jgi:hypothetical protein
LSAQLVKILFSHKKVRTGLTAMKNFFKEALVCVVLMSGLSCKSFEGTDSSTGGGLNFSGIYPHLAYSNEEAECGTGAVVPWADRLWVGTYGPHLPYGSSDKLYEITSDLQIATRAESIGGTGPWKKTPAKQGEPSDSYLIGFYDKKNLLLSHTSMEPVTFTIETQPVGHGPWMEYMKVKVGAGETFEHSFPADFQARWIRFTLGKSATATAWLTYDLNL